MCTFCITDFENGISFTSHVEHENLLTIIPHWALRKGWKDNNHFVFYKSFVFYLQQKRGRYFLYWTFVFKVLRLLLSVLLLNRLKYVESGQLRMHGLKPFFISSILSLKKPLMQWNPYPNTWVARLSAGTKLIRKNKVSGKMIPLFFT